MIGSHLVANFSPLAVSARTVQYRPKDIVESRLAYSSCDSAGWSCLGGRLLYVLPWWVIVSRRLMVSVEVACIEK